MKLTSDQKMILDHLSGSSGTATHWISGNIEKSMSKTRYQLRKLESLGLVEGIPASMSGRIYWWKISPSGRAALAQGGRE